MQIKVRQITTGFSELPEAENKVFYSWKEANDFFRRVNDKVIELKKRGKMLGYYKTDFKILFDDGEEYAGRYDIGADEPNLSSHVQRFCLIYSGQLRPSHFTDEIWAQFKQDSCTPEVVMQATKFLNKYDLGKPLPA